MITKPLKSTTLNILFSITLLTFSGSFGYGEDTDNNTKDLEVIFDLLLNEDIEELKKDSLNLDQIGRPDGNHIADLSGRFDRNRTGELGSMDRHREGFDSGLSRGTLDGVTNLISGLLQDSSSQEFEIVVLPDGTWVVVFWVDSGYFDNASEDSAGLGIEVLDSVYKRNRNGVISTWAFKGENGEKNSGKYLHDAIWSAYKAVYDQQNENNDSDDKEEGEEREAFGGTDSDFGNEGGPLNKERPIIVGDNTTIRLAEPEGGGGGTLEKPVKGSTDDTLRIDSNVQEQLKGLYSDMLNAGVVALLEILANGGDGFDPDNSNGDKDEFNPGQIEGGVGPGGGPTF